MIIPTEYDELILWVHEDAFRAADAIVNLQRIVTQDRALLRKLLAETLWMTGSQDFGPGGKAEHGFNVGVKPVIAECEALLASE